MRFTLLMRIQFRNHPILTLVAVLSACALTVNTLYASMRTTQVGKVEYMHVQYAADFSDDRILIGASHNVFVGKVLAQSGEKERGIGPETQFEVEIIENLKGELSGTVIVNQQGGQKNEILRLVEGGVELLQPGSTYLFATRYNEKENWHTLNPFPTASKLISKSQDIEQLKRVASVDERVNQLKAAYPNEILLDADVRTGKTYNDYQARKPLPNQKAEEAVAEEVRVIEPEPEESQPIEEADESEASTEIQ